MDYDDPDIMYSRNLEGNRDVNKERNRENTYSRSRLERESARQEFKEKMEKIFREVYSFHSSGSQVKSTQYLENEIHSFKVYIDEKFLSSKIEYLALFTKLLNDNISHFIKSFKEKITEDSINKKLKRKYTELKNSIHNDMNNKESDQNVKQKEAKYKKCLLEIITFCRENSNEIISIVSDLNKTYQNLVKSSSILNNAFESAMIEIVKEYEIVLSLENLHKEEFFNMIINDDFIKSLIIEVKNKDLPDFVKLRPIIVKIEEDISNSSKDMKLLKTLVKDLEKELKELEDMKKHELNCLTDPRSLNNYIISASKYLYFM